MSFHIFGLKKKRVKSLGLGIFDGFHLGHALIAKKATGILTFYPHPDIFLGKNKALKMLSTLREQRYFNKNLLVLRFNDVIASLDPQQFLDKIVKEIINPKKIIVGEDFKFGKKQVGDVCFLKKWGQVNDIDVETIKLLSQKEQVVKSTLIRRMILDGKFNEAISKLGHPYLIIGKVIRGDGRGRQIGFPTANITTPKDKLIPTSGVYSGYVILDKKKLASLIYIGTRPTFKTKNLAVEVHILKFQKNIYNRNLKVFLDKKVREDCEFSDVSALVKQIELDIKTLKK
jgi:riboflavin kinase / FMN adenylyltransferase